MLRDAGVLFTVTWTRWQRLRCWLRIFGHYYEDHGTYLYCPCCRRTFAWDWAW